MAKQPSKYNPKLGVVPVNLLLQRARENQLMVVYFSFVFRYDLSQQFFILCARDDMSSGLVIQQPQG
jgi:hypothetical protein